MKSIRQKLDQLIADIDAKIEAQASLILHDKVFMQLESKWRGLMSLMDSVDAGIRHLQSIKILCMTDREFAKDLGRTSDYEQTFLFKLLYNQEYDMAGGSPFAMLLLDINIDKKGPYDHLSIIENIMAIAGSCFLPCLLQASPEWFGLDCYEDLAKIKNTHIFNSLSHSSRIERLRSFEDARYLFFVCQRYLWREPFQYRYQSNGRYGFFENNSGKQQLCWGSATYLIAKLVLKNYQQTGWFSDINQIKLELPKLYHQSDYAKTTPLPRLELNLFDQESEVLSSMGCLILKENLYDRTLRLDKGLAWYKPYHKAKDNLTTQQAMACVLAYLLCVCRFAHYLKVLGRQKIGSIQNADDLQAFLQKWVFRYCGGAESFDSNKWLKYPLKSALIKVVDQPKLPGHFLCSMDLQPNFRIDQVHTHLRLVSIIGKAA